MADVPAGARVLVLGGSGFLGRHVCAAFAGSGWQVTATVWRRSNPDVTHTLRVDLADIDPAELAALLTELRPSAVVNCAGLVWNASDDDMQRSNVVLTERVVAALRMLSRSPRLVQVGSVAEYAPVPAPALITEDCPDETHSVYGRTKAEASASVLAAARAQSIDGVVLRVTHVLGSGVPLDSLLGRVAAQLNASVADGERRTVELRPLDAVRDYLDVRDMARAVVSAATADVTARLFNIGSGTPIVVRDLVDLLVAESAVQATVVERPADGQGRTARHGGDWQVVDAGAAARSLGWKPLVPLVDSIRAVWAAAARERSAVHL